MMNGRESRNVICKCLLNNNKNTSLAIDKEGSNTWGVMIPQERNVWGIRGAQRGPKRNNIILFLSLCL
jgi:hypothetical protein